MHFDPAILNGQKPSQFPNGLVRKKLSLNAVSSGPLSMLLPLPYPRVEFAVVSAWAVLLKSYYSHDPISFLRFGGPWTRTSPDEAGKPEPISLQLQSEWNASDLQEAISQKDDSLLTSNQGHNDDPERFAVWVANEEDIPTNAQCEREILDLTNESQICLLLVAKQTQQGNVILNLHTSRERPCQFELPSLLDSLRKILDSLVYHPFKMIKDIEVISNQDRLCLREWMEADPPKPATTIHGLVNRQYHERPAHIAISSTSGDITYEELGIKSAAMARKLRENGVGAGDIVGVCVKKSALSLMILLAILRAGAGYIPIATSIPIDRMEYITRKAELQVLVTESPIIERLKGHDSFHEFRMITPTYLDQEEALSNEWASELEADPSQVAYAMFTSGSTGQPKGVAHNHGAVSGSLEAVAQIFELDCSTRFLQFASFSFDASICEIFAPWVVGGTVCIPSEDERIGNLAWAMHELNVTDASLTPAIVASLRPESLPTLRNLYIGGEAPTTTILSTWADKVRLSNIYGLTEGGVWDTVKLKLGSNDSPKAIGRGIGAKCWIVDPENIRKLQPIGVEGEVLLQSPYLAKGFLGDTAGSSDAFISLPESLSTLTGPSSARCYRTGDLARCQPGGGMIFTGRRAGFVKIRGLRVELGEIEKAIRDYLHTDEQAAVILARDEKNDSPELVAFVEQKEGRPSSFADQMSAGLQNVLPSYMVPSAFVTVQSMPLTESKKIHRQELAARWASMTLSDTMAFRPGGTLSHTWSRIDPANPRAIALSNIIANIVETKRPSAGEILRGWDFPLTSVGLDSIQTAYLSGEIRRHLGGATQIQDLLQPGVTVCQLDRRLSECNGDGFHGPRDLLGELSSIDVQVVNLAQKKKTIFATSVTGFLGSQLLRGLLESPNVERIVGLVRAGSEKQAREKIRAQAQLGQWWQAEFDSQIEVWLGDLSLPKLGLDDAHWKDLTGHLRIDGIIHNGARVNWMDDFSTLKPTNVDSTCAILEALSEMPTPCPFTYVSGGYLPLPTETREQVLHNLAHASGYDQTKFLSRMMVERYNHQLEQWPNTSTPRARVVHPGYLAGTRWEGIAHPEDFLWRLAYCFSSLETVSSDMLKAHIPVAGVEQVTSLVVDSVLNPQGKQVVDCHDGVSVETLCKIISSCSGRSIRTVSHGEWMAALRADVERSALDHPFLPVLDWFEANMEQFTGPSLLEWPTAFNQRDTIAALDKSTRYLMSIGFLPCEDGSRMPVGQPSSPQFQRSSK